MSKELEYYFDYVSPYSYLANSQVPGLVERTGATLCPKPMLLGGVMKATGNTPPPTVPAKAAYMAKDIPRWLERYGLPFEMNPHFPPNTVTLMRGALVALEEGSFDVYSPAIFRAMWVDKLNPDVPEEITAVLEAAGLDAAHILARCGEQEIKDRLRANTEEAVSRGVFGAPTFFVGDQMFFGNDRLDFVEATLA